MPLYEYRCKTCPEFKHSEIKAVDKRDEMPICTECNSKENVKRGLHTSGLWFKGLGWYRPGKSKP